MNSNLKNIGKQYFTEISKLFVPIVCIRDVMYQCIQLDDSRLEKMGNTFGFQVDSIRTESIPDVVLHTNNLSKIPIEFSQSLFLSPLACRSNISYLVSFSYEETKRNERSEIELEQKASL